MNSRKFSVKTERFYSAHHALLRIAKDNLTKAETKEPGWFDSQFTAIVFSSLAIEALSNAVGGLAINKWNGFESCSPIAKTRLVCEYLNIDYGNSKEPWRTVIWLLKTRNLIAHPKTELITNEAVIFQQELDSQKYRSLPKLKFEKRITLENAKRSVDTVNEMVSLFCEKLIPKQNFGVISDMWHSSAKLHDGSTI